MFDVESFQAVSNGKVSFKGLYDNDETAFLNNLRKSQQSENNNGGKLLAQLFQLLQATFNNSASEVFIPFLNKGQFPGLEQSPVAAFIIILSPPPQA